MTPDTTASPCPACQAVNLPGVKFCAQCGSPLTAATPRVATPPAAAAPAAPAATAPTFASTDVIATARDVLTRANATITGGDGHTTLDYDLPYSDWRVSLIKLHYAGTVTSVPGGSPAYAVTARMVPMSMLLQGVGFIAGCMVLGFLPRSLVSNDVFVGSVALGLGLQAWVTFSYAAKRVQRHVEGMIHGATGGVAGATPMPAQITAPTSAATTSATPGGDVFAQLERLAQMQATGLLSADDVATKKAELLARI